MSSRLYLFTVLCLIAAAVSAVNTRDPAISAGEPVYAVESPDQISPRQDEARQHVASEEEDPQTQKSIERQEETREEATQVEAVEQAA